MKNGRRHHFGIGVAPLALLLAPACATIAGLDQDYREAPTCEPVRPPDPPGASGASGNVEFVTAIRKVDIDEEDETPRFGYDLDGKCSCTIDGQSCTKPGYIDPKKVVCDDEHGLDNGTGIALARINAISGGAVTSVLINEGVTQGSWSLLVRVRGYSGGADDDQIEVALYETPGALAPPIWDGSMSWPVSNTSVNGASVDAPVYVDAKAFVRGGVLRAHFSIIPMLFRAQLVRLPVTITNAIVTAKITDMGMGRYKLAEGLVAGTWTHASMFQALSGLRYGSNGDDKLCKDDLTYLQVRNMFCSVTDLYDEASAAPGTGGGSAASPECNAISFGMRFEAEPALLGAVSPPAPAPADTCGAGLDPGDDKCR